MKKKLFTLLTLLCAVVGMQAADYTVTATRVLSNSNLTSTWSEIKANGGAAFQSGKTALGDGMYFVATGKCTLNGAQINVKGGGIMYLEVPSATAAGSVTINGGSSDTRYFETISEGKVYTKGTNTLAFTSSDIEEVDGVNYLKLTSQSDCKFTGVSITLTSGKYITILPAPTISVAGATGTVTITADANASSVKYTTDGSEPSAVNGTTYSAPFVAAEGTTVKAIALGDGTSYADSPVETKQVLLTGIKMATPTFTQFNGTVLLATTSPAASIYYTIDGSTPSASSTLYKYPFTLTADATVKAIVVREGCTDSDIASEAVAVVTNTKKKTVIMGYGSFDNSDKKNLTGMSGDEAEGFILTADANLESGNQTNTALGKTFIKLPTNRQFTLTMPEGWAATKITFHSFINTSSSSTKSGWSEVAGVSYASYTDIPMGAFNNLSGFNENPDVRVYALDNATSITFRCSGDQLCVIIEVDVVEAETIAITSAGWASFSSTNEVAIPTGVTAYYASASDGSKVTLTEIAGGYIPANTGVIVAGAEGSYGAAITSTSATLGGTNLLKAWTAAGTPSDAEYYTLAVDASTPVFKKSTGGTLAAGKAYLVVPSSARESLDINFGEETTGINAIKENANNRYFNLQGVEVAQPTKGLYIVNGKKVLVK